MKIEEIGSLIVDSALKVHQSLGPGLLESAYQVCLAHELAKRGLEVSCEVPLPVIYDGVNIATGYRLDMLVENCVIIENKAVETISPLHEAQLLTYLKLTGFWLGYIINWNTRLMKYGIRRRVNGVKPEEE
jgi:GxxExxY protein